MDRELSGVGGRCQSQPRCNAELADIEGTQPDIACGKAAKPQVGDSGGATAGGEEVAAQTVSTLHRAFGQGVRSGMIETYPARRVRSSYLGQHNVLYVALPILIKPEPLTTAALRVSIVSKPSRMQERMIA